MISRMREIITNTSPLLYLHQLGELAVLSHLYSRVLVPRRVVEELDAGKAGGHDVPALVLVDESRKRCAFRPVRPELV
jgi:predicted nucleic acid-binding protein